MKKSVKKSEILGAVRISVLRFALLPDEINQNQHPHPVSAAETDGI